MRLNIFVCLLLAGVTMVIYWPVRQYDIVYYDDPAFLTYVDVLHQGISWAGIKWALTSIIAANWHPVTNLSFLVLSQFFGVAPGPQHIANAVIHAANAALLFLLLQRLTGRTWRCAAVAAIFAWHPLRVESVAWIAERKDVLCAFFYFISLWGYTVHVERLNKAGGNKSRLWTMPIVVSLTAFTMALLSKPMAVTLPFALLVLDFWPLGRLRTAYQKQGSTGTAIKRMAGNFFQLVLEKWPFFFLMALFCVATYKVHARAEDLIPWSVLGFSDRVVNCINAYTSYLGKMFWPTNLAVIYPLYPWHNYYDAILKGSLLGLITLGCLFQSHKRPWLVAGWVWYLVMAAPTIGLVQEGAQTMEDRYTYIPLIGPVVAIVWTTAEALGTWRGGKVLLATTAIAICGTLAVLSERQLQYWRNTVDLFRHTIAVTPINPAATYSWAVGLDNAGQDRLAITAYRMTIIMAPDTEMTSDALANLYLRDKLPAGAEAEYNRFLGRHPDDYPFRVKLAALYAETGQSKESIEQLDRLVNYHGEDPQALNGLAWALATTSDPAFQDGSRAVQLAERACELTHYEKTIYIGTLAAAYAEAGRFDEAVATAQMAIANAQKQGETDLVQTNEKLLELYREHKSYHEGSNK